MFHPKRFKNENHGGLRGSLMEKEEDDVMKKSLPSSCLDYSLSNKTTLKELTSARQTECLCLSLVVPDA